MNPLPLFPGPLQAARETPALALRIAAERCFAGGSMQERGKKKHGEGRKWRVYSSVRNATPAKRWNGWPRHTNWPANR